MNATMIARRPRLRRRHYYAGATEESEYVKPKIGVGAALAAILAVVLISNR